MADIRYPPGGHRDAFPRTLSTIAAAASAAVSAESRFVTDPFDTRRNTRDRGSTRPRKSAHNTRLGKQREDRFPRYPYGAISIVAFLQMAPRTVAIVLGGRGSRLGVKRGQVAALGLAAKNLARFHRADLRDRSIVPLAGPRKADVSSYGWPCATVWAGPEAVVALARLVFLPAVLRVTD